MGLFLLRMLMTVLADKAVNRAIILELWERAKHTDNDVDDAMVAGVAKALGVELPAG